MCDVHQTEWQALVAWGVLIVEVWHCVGSPAIGEVVWDETGSKGECQQSPR